MARRSKKVEEQMQLFEEGGLKDEGGTVDPVSGNDVPVGSTQKEVRDDIPAQLSEGEFVFPADVTRYIGLENLMELRNKAKKGLAQMEAMGQMGNSDEATMDDTEEMDVDIDALIDAFDPNSPESMQFSMGGVVKAQAGAVIPGQMPPQQFSYGYQPPQQQAGYTPPQTPQTQFPDYSQFVSRPAQQAVGQQKGVTEQRQYIGPNGEMITIMFMDGVPQQEIPAGYKVYKPEEQKTPEVAQPVVSQQDGGGDSQGDREREAEREAQMARDKEINNTLAAYNTDFAKQWSEDPFNTGKLGIGGPMAAAWDSVQTHMGRTPAIESIAKEYGINLENYKNEGIKGFFSKYDDERFAKDLKAKYESPAEKTQREANEKARAPEIAALRAKEAERISNLTAEQQIARDVQKEQNFAQAQQAAQAIRESDGGGGEGGPSNAGGTTDSFSGGRDADGWGE